MRFTKQVRDALLHLLDAPALQRHPLLRVLVAPGLADPKAAGQALREAILEAINDLRPPLSTSPLAPAYRPYAILQQRFVDGFESEAIAQRLAISMRQFFREQERAVEAVANLLWQRRTDGEGGGASGGLTLSEELEELGLQSQAFPLREAVEQAIDAVASLAAERAVAFSVTADGEPQAFADMAITRQVLVSLASLLVQSVSKAYLQAHVRQEGDWSTCCFSGTAPADLARLEPELSLPTRLAESMGGRIEAGVVGAGDLRLCVPAAGERTVVIVDDNARALRLFERYLRPYRYHLVLTQDSTHAVEQIRETGPDAVVLDVMMRAVDGWQILQALKGDARTRDIPVIVCSVLNEERLAMTVGADAYLRKPVSPLELYRALESVRRR